MRKILFFSLLFFSNHAYITKKNSFHIFGFVVESMKENKIIIIID